MGTAISSCRDLPAESFGAAGPPIVLLHGWGQSRADLRPLAQLLARAATAHAVDLPGFGESPPPDGAWSTEDYAACLHGHLAARRIVAPILLGHSFGGRVVVQFARLYPAETRGIVLLAAAGLPRRRGLAQRMRLRGLKALGALLRVAQGVTRLPTHDWFVEKFGSRDYKQAGALRGVLVKAVNEDLSSAARAIRCPALLIWGEQDEESPPEIGRRYQALIAGSRLLVLPGKGHFPHRGAGAHLVASHILDWLAALA